MNTEQELNRFIEDAWHGKEVNALDFRKSFEQLSSYDGISIIRKERLSDDKQLIYMWAPAGNQSGKAKLIVSGFSTSIQAAQYIRQGIISGLASLKNSNISSALRSICARSVYRGIMLKRLAWGLVKILPVLSNKLSVDLYKTVRSEWMNIEDLANRATNVLEGEGPIFDGHIDCQVIFTQSTLNGLAILEKEKIVCSANRIPIRKAFEMSSSFLRQLVESNSDSLLVVLILGHAAAQCWNKIIIENSKKFISMWWREDLSTQKNSHYLILRLPHPSGANPTYEDDVKIITSLLDKD